MKILSIVRLVKKGTRTLLVMTIFYKLVGLNKKKLMNDGIVIILLLQMLCIEDETIFYTKNLTRKVKLLWSCKT